MLVTMFVRMDIREVIVVYLRVVLMEYRIKMKLELIRVEYVPQNYVQVLLQKFHGKVMERGNEDKVVLVGQVHMVI